MTLRAVREYWERNVCELSSHPSLESLEHNRIASLEFMKPTHYAGRMVLEIGVGSGVDFIQWYKAGCVTYGVDLTLAAVAHTRSWLEKLDAPEEVLDRVQLGDAECLPFPSDHFDLVYSWGVLHHSPDTASAVKECIRVCKPGGEIKLMLYNKYSLMWLLTLINYYLRGKQLESPGTKAFSKAQIVKMLRGCQVLSIESKTCKYDTYWKYNWLLRAVASLYNYLTGNEHGWFTTIVTRKL